MEQGLRDEEIEFLQESNNIEREYSDVAMDDAINAWNFAKKHSHVINVDFIKCVHQELMLRLNPKIAGKIRKCPIYVGNSKEYRECLKPEYVLGKLVGLVREWEDFYKKWKNAVTDCSMSDGLKRRKQKEQFLKEWHIKFELIHPFEDGNGRVGRIIMNIQRGLIGLGMLIIHEGVEQFEYYKWFKEGQDE